VEEIKPHVAAIPRLTTFEITTALAFWYFQRREVDVAVIEVGLGGRLDATNVITPVVSVITALFLEHTQILGHSIEEIAAEKAGIIKPGVPLVLGPQQEAARKVVCQIADQRAAPVISVEEHFPYALQSFSLDGQRFSIRRGTDEEDGAGQELSISLLGTHQVENAAIAYATLRVAGDQGLKISDQAIRRGFARARWPARFEVVSRQPPLILDSAHIPAAARKLRITLDDYFPGLPVILVIGVSEDKDVRHMLIELQPRVRMIIATQSDHPRALDTTVLAEIIEDLGMPVKPIPVVKDALVEALHLVGDEAIVLVTGSIFVAASARIAWLEELSPMQKVRHEAG
jgi:dihydrofolate synthase/folylpolyglutamate synthase